MEIYLMRHGEAIDPMFWDRGDRTRPLSDLGEVKVFNASKAMTAQNFKPEVILSSPFTRAQQTAEIIAQALTQGEFLTQEKLASGARMADFKEAVGPFLNHKSILVVGHMPDVAIFLSLVTGKPGHLEARFSTGQMVGVDIPSADNKWGEGNVLWERQIEDWSKL